MRALLLAGAAAFGWVGAAKADVTSFDVFKNQQYTQTSSAQPTSPSAAFFTSAVNVQSSADASTVSATSSDGPLAYSYASNTFSYSANFASPAAMDAAFVPGSNYAITLSGGSLGTQTASFALAADTYPSAVPYLTGSSYASLQGLNAGSGATLTLNGFTAPASSTEAYLFATIYQVSTNAVVFADGFLAPSTTSLTIAAGTLASNTAYVLDLDFSSRVDTLNAGFGNSELFQGFEQRTEVAFTTSPAAAVPEPASLALLALPMGAAGLVVARRRRKGEHAA